MSSNQSSLGDKEKVRKKRCSLFLGEKFGSMMVASDMHNLGPRPPFMKDAYEIVKKNYGSKRAKNLFIENPKTLLEKSIFIGDIMNQDNTKVMKSTY